MAEVVAGFSAYVAGTEFSGRRYDHTPGFYVKEHEGLLGGASVSAPGVKSLNGSGELSLPNRRDSARLIRLSGFVDAKNEADLGVALRRLDGILSGDRDLAEFSWTEFGTRFHAMVRRGASTPAQRRSATRADYTIRFRAPSQVYYGEAHRFAAGERVIQRGTYPSRPLLQVAGSAPGGYTITGPGGRRVVVTRALTAGTPHLIDMRRGGLFEGGVRRTLAMSVYEPWAIPTGPTGATHTITGGLTLNGVAYDAFT